MELPKKRTIHEMTLQEKLRIKNKQSYIPDPIQHDSFVLSTDFHPKQDIIVTGQISGQIEIHKYSTKGNECVKKYKKIHTDSVRGLQLNFDGDKIMTSSMDRSWAMIDMEAQVPILRVSNAHDVGITASCSYDNNTFVTGDDNGMIRIWDVRSKKVIDTLTEHGDYISSFDYVPEDDRLFAGSGDGCLMAYDMKKHELIITSETIRDDILSVLAIQEYNIVLAGTNGGKVYVFPYRVPYKSNNAFPSKADSVDSMLLLRDNFFACASVDGDIHMYQCKTAKRREHCKRIADHEGAVTKISLSRDGMFLSSCGDDMVKFWDVGQMFRIQVEQEGFDEEGNVVMKKPEMRTNSQRNLFFSDFVNQDKELYQAKKAKLAETKAKEDQDREDAEEDEDDDDDDDEAGFTTTDEEDDEKE
jgi:WD40 repeat protein